MDIANSRCGSCGSDNVVVEEYSRELQIHRAKRVASGLLHCVCRKCEARFETEHQYRHNLEIEARIRDSVMLMTPEMIRELRLAYGLSQREAGTLFGGGPVAFAKYEAGEVTPAAAMMRLLRLAYDNSAIVEQLASLTRVEIRAPIFEEPTDDDRRSVFDVVEAEFNIVVPPVAPSVRKAGIFKLERDDRQTYTDTASANEARFGDRFSQAVAA